MWNRDLTEIIAVLCKLYGFSDSYVVLLEAFFSRQQKEGETLQEFQKNVIDVQLHQIITVCAL